MQLRSAAKCEENFQLAVVSRFAAIPIVLTGGAVGAIAGQFSSLAIAEGIGLTVVISLFTLMIWWPLRQFAISWIVLAVVIVVHLVAVFAIPWPHQDRANKLILLIFLIDVFSVIIISDKVLQKSQASQSNRSRSQTP